MADRRLPSSLRPGRKQIYLGGIIAAAGAKKLDSIARDLRATSQAMRDIGLNRSFLMIYIRNKPEVMQELFDAWVSALYGSSPLTGWFKKTRPLQAKGIPGGPGLGVPVDSGALQDALTYEDAEGAIHEVSISRNGSLSFRYGAAPQRQYEYEQGPGIYAGGSSYTKVPAGNPDNTYIDEINAFYSEGGQGFFEIGIEQMGRSARLKDLRAQVAGILRREAATYIAERRNR
jgi:hypothetical protein